MGEMSGIAGFLRGPARLARASVVVAAVASAFAACAAPGTAQENGTGELRSMSTTFAGVARQVSPAVVYIHVEKTIHPASDSGMPQFGDPFLDQFFRHFNPMPPADQRVEGQGSGFIISPDGYVMTNNHVVGEADKVQVKLGDGREFEAKVVGTDPHTDIAVIRIDAKDLPIVPLGDSDAIEVGDWVVALGNPFGLTNTLTAGVISAKGRSQIGIADYEDFIQTDAAINPGNSGGPLVNLDGEAVAINTAIFSRTGGSMGIGFAIPINMAKGIRDQLIEHGSVSRGYLGIVIQDLTPDLARNFGLSNEKGILVSDVKDGSPADRAGMRRGDVIVEADGEPVTEIGPFRNKIALLGPSRKVHVAFLRGGKRQSAIITTEELQEDSAPASGGQVPDTNDRLGLTAQDLTADLAERLGFAGERGVVVTSVRDGSPADAAGLRRGSLIREVNRTPVNDMNQFDAALRQAEGDVLLLVRDGSFTHYVVLKIEKKD
jgi:serine protease Do